MVAGVGPGVGRAQHKERHFMRAVAAMVCTAEPLTAFSHAIRDPPKVHLLGITVVNNHTMLAVDQLNCSGTI
jgi:hypothetical protein